MKNIFNKFSISKKILLSFTVILTIFLLQSIFILVTSAKISDSINDFNHYSQSTTIFLKIEKKLVNYKGNLWSTGNQEEAQLLKE